MPPSITSYLPVLSICGYSGAGKTTVIEPLVRHLTGQGYRIAVAKNDIHGLQVDKPGKDSDRLFKAGADVLLREDSQAFFRSHQIPHSELLNTVSHLMLHYDLILLEGHKSTPHFQKLWLLSEGEQAPPAGTNDVRMILGRDEDRFDRILEYLSEWLPTTLRRVPRYLGVIADTTISDTDQFHQFKGLADEIVILSRAPQQLPYPMVSPVLEDDIPATLAAVSAARRWAPLVQWTFAGVDQLSSSTLEIRRILTTPPSPIAQQHASLALPMSIDFRRGWSDKED